MKLKFCGLTRKEDIEAANETKPDFIGFVFAESRRHVSDMMRRGSRSTSTRRLRRSACS